MTRGCKLTASARARSSRRSIMGRFVLAHRTAYPGRGNPKTPSLHKFRAGQFGIELGVALGEPRTARLDQRRLVRKGRRKKAQALEDGAVFQDFGVADEHWRIGVRMTEVCREAVGDMANTAT